MSLLLLLAETIIKRCLTFTTKDRPISEEALVTFLTEVEAALNSRPLTKLSNKINDFNVLTLNRFILEKRPLYFSPEMIKDNHVTNKVGWKSCSSIYKNVSATLCTRIPSTVADKKKMELSSTLYEEKRSCYCSRRKYP